MVLEVVILLSIFDEREAALRTCGRDVGAEYGKTIPIAVVQTKPLMKAELEGS